jgi:hypothetical protein
MIAEADIENALKARVATIVFGRPIAWPNQEFTASPPFATVQIVRVERTDRTMNGDETISRGRIIVTLVDRLGTSTKTANTLADTVAAAFPVALRIPVTGGQIVIMKPTDIREGFRDGSEWRTPIIIDYQAS